MADDRDTAHSPQLPNALTQARHLAQKQAIHKRQCLLLCGVIERTLVDPNSASESAQQLDDTLNNLLERFSNWANFDVIQSYLNSDGIQDGIDELVEELRWCGIHTENLQWAEKRRQDTDGLRDQLRIIVSDPTLLEQVFSQPKGSIALFVQRCQYAIKDNIVTDSARPRIESALKQLYKHQSVHIPTPELTSQILNITGTASNVRALYKVFSGNWLDQENVTIRSLRYVQSNTEAVKRFREDLARYNLVRHQNIARIYGYLLSKTLGCCLVSPLLADPDSLSYLQQHGDTNVVLWLRDISSAIFYLHKLKRPIFCGILQAENILIREDGSAYLADFGILQLSRKPWEAVHSLLRWCAPEVIRAAKKREQGEDVASIFTKQSDIYSFELFSGEVPVHHIEDETSLEPEILHNNRPYMSTDIKNRAKSFGFNDDLQQLMHRCWQAEARSRPDTREVVESLTEQTPNVSPRMHIRRSELSSSSILSSASSTTSSVPQPLTPPSDLSGLPAGSAENTEPSTNYDFLFDRSYSPVMSRNTQFADPGIMTSEPTQLQDVGANYRQQSVPMLNKSLMQNVHAQSPISPSEHTPRAVPDRRSIQSTNSEESHLGQREDFAYERMPPLRRAGIQPPRRRGSGDTFSIVVSRMREDGQINPNWTGVADMERIRGMTRQSSRLKQVSAVENLIKHEKKFSEDKTHEYFTRKLEDAFGILGDKVDEFLSCIFDDATTLRLWNYQFLNALEASSDVSAVGFRPFAALCKEAAVIFRTFYPEYVSHIPAILSIIKKEAAANRRFAAFMSESAYDKSHLKLLEDFIIAPVTHLDRHHLTLQLILNEMPKDDRDIPELKDAYKDMLQTVNAIKLTTWQSTHEKKEWKDFVSADTVKEVSKVDITRQMLIYELIAEERDYTAKLRVIHTLLNNIVSNLEGGRSDEDTKSLRLLAAAFKEFIRFHERLLELLFKAQRELHPWIKTFVASCGIHLIPWHALYDYRYTSAYLKVASVLQDENKIRQGVISNCIQSHMPEEPTNLLQIVRIPGQHLRTFVDRLQRISATLPVDDEDQQVITEILPRLQDVTRQVELKLSSKDDARLSSLSLALDFSAFPSVEKFDIDLLAKSRVLVFSSKLKIGFGNSSPTRTMPLQTRLAFLLDNYLILTKKDDRPEYPSLTVSEKPIPLDIVSISEIKNFPYTLSEKTYPCLLLKIADHEQMYLFAESEAASKTWYQKLESTIQERLDARVDIITPRVIDRFFRPPNCSADIVYSGNYATITAREAPTPGIWLSLGTDARLLHQLSGITKLLVLDDSGILLAMAGQSLFWFKLDDLLGSGRTTQRSVDNDITVSWFRAGFVAKRLLLVVSATKKKSNKPLLRFYEIRSIKPSRSLPSLKSKAPFALLTEIELTSSIRDIYFLRNSLILVTDTFQVVNYHNPQQLKDSISGGKLPTLPLNDDPMTDLVDKCRYSFPISIHRVDKEFVLCYREFAVYINENGRLSNKVIKWVSKDVHNVLFRPPHMLTFGSSMMEVRDIVTGLLVQIVPLLGQMHISWEAAPRGEENSDLGIHLLVSEGQDRQLSTGWNSLDEQRSTTLIRLLRQ